MIESEYPTLQEFLDDCNNCDIGALRDEIAAYDAGLEAVQQRWEERFRCVDAQAYTDQMRIIRQLSALIQRQDIICGTETPIPVPFRIEIWGHGGRSRGPDALMFDRRRSHDNEPPANSKLARKAWHNFTTKLGIPPAQLRFALGLGWIAVYRLNYGGEIYVNENLAVLDTHIRLSPCASSLPRNTPAT